MNNQEKQYAYSLNEESYTGSMTSKVEAIAEGLAEAKDQEQEHFWIGECSPFKPSGMADTVIEQLQSQAGDEVGEHADDYLSHVSKEHKATLDEFIRKWVDEIETPCFYSVGNAVQYSIAGAEAFLDAQQKETA